MTLSTLVFFALHVFEPRWHRKSPLMTFASPRDLLRCLCKTRTVLSQKPGALANKSGVVHFSNLTDPQSGFSTCGKIKRTKDSVKLKMWKSMALPPHQVRIEARIESDRSYRFACLKLFAPTKFVNRIPSRIPNVFQNTI
jgi:hypothetical protein